MKCCSCAHTHKAHLSFITALSLKYLVRRKEKGKQELGHLCLLSFRIHISPVMKSSPSLYAHTEKKITRTCVCFSFLCKIVCNSDDDAAFIPFKRHTLGFFLYTTINPGGMQFFQLFAIFSHQINWRSIIYCIRVSYFITLLFFSQ